MLLVIGHYLQHLRSGSVQPKYHHTEFRGMWHSELEAYLCSHAVETPTDILTHTNAHSYHFIQLSCPHVTKYQLKCNIHTIFMSIVT